MTNSEYIEIMCSLMKELKEIRDALPYDSAAYNALVKKICRLDPPFVRGRRRRPWAALAACISLLIVLLYIVFNILNNLWIIGAE